ncbi:hypothetical protein GTA08_BOTSDO14205 [Botryosphaeria dothidea]|uniref:Uncharacterized protein n=1 Tax=Botryosphaeria dothidea TaxID=55169 RepID=A0A8H4IR49_9PEZI|nr:hypothetical protein GTA08_BOTSDO14205 [Botryosphaeria dothidea]
MNIVSRSPRRRRDGCSECKEEGQVRSRTPCLSPGAPAFPNNANTSPKFILTKSTPVKNQPAQIPAPRIPETGPQHRFDAARQPSRAAAAGPAAATHPAPVAAALVTDGPLPPPPLRHADRAPSSSRSRRPPSGAADDPRRARAHEPRGRGPARGGGASGRVLRVETAMTAMALCTNDVCDGGDARQWRVHLAA